MGTDQYDRAEVINAIWSNKGNISAAARDIGCGARTIYYMADRYKTVQQAIDHARRIWRGELVDSAEQQLKDHVEEGRAWAVKYVLDTVGKKRGYVTRHEITGADGAPLIGIDVVEFDYTDHLADLAPGSVPDSNGRQPVQGAGNGAKMG